LGLWRVEVSVNLLASSNSLPKWQNSLTPDCPGKSADVESKRMWEFSQERRVAERHPVHLEFRVLLIATRKDATGHEQTLPLIGYTRDISETGLALLVAAKSVGVLYSLGQNYTLQLVLTIPSGSVELEVTPVRYGHINEGAEGSRILIGAQITKISERDQTRLSEYLDSFR
jgi:hypothetical protein